jgi:dolichyl-phosphate-mannose--protein O-mannosyl transferase
VRLSEILHRIQQPAAVGLFLITLLSFFSYVHNYAEPDALFWDENYHIASAQKYIHGVFFMEPHPPLGKLLIAAGELLLSPNEATDQFIGTDYAKDPPKGFSFAGYRLFPVLLGWLCAPIFFGIMFVVTRRSLLATLLSFLYVFDNAIIVHSRSAMLESAIHFFLLAMLLCFLLVLRSEHYSKQQRIFAVVMGMAFGALVTTKLNGLVMLVLFPMLLWHFRNALHAGAEVFVLTTAGFLLVFVPVWHTHFALGSRVITTLPDGNNEPGFYQASPAYKAIVREGKNGSLLNFPVMLADSMNFVGHYERGVPPLDLCKSGENGSPWFLWPFGGRTISFRWATPNGYAYQYLYLVPNLVGWMVSLAGVILAAGLLLASAILPLKEKLQHGFLMFTLLGLYGGYMVAISRIDRVMYLYHYFPALLFGYVLFAIAIMEIRRLGPIAVTASIRTGIVFACAMAVFANYEYFRPLTYYKLITDAEFQQRNWLQIWDMKCVKCERDSMLVKKTC